MNQNKKRKMTQKLKVGKLVNSMCNYKRKRKENICFEVGFKLIDTVISLKIHF